MATEVTTRLRDDIDGSVADRTVSFSWEGTQYEIDLSKKNLAGLDAILAPYVAASRRIGANAPGPSAPTTGEPQVVSSPSSGEPGVSRGGITLLLE